jgi:hypothetical protein
MRSPWDERHLTVAVLAAPVGCSSVEANTDVMASFLNAVDTIIKISGQIALTSGTKNLPTRKRGHRGTKDVEQLPAAAPFLTVTVTTTR